MNEWAKAGKQRWRCGMNQTQELKCRTVDVCVDPMKGVGSYGQ